MYGTLADPEPPGGLPYRGTVLDDVGGQFAGPFLDIPFQDQHSPYPDMFHVYAGMEVDILFKTFLHRLDGARYRRLLVGPDVGRGRGSTSSRWVFGTF